MSPGGRFDTALLMRLPPALGRLWWRLRHLPADWAERAARARDPLVPPRGRAFVGAGDFAAVGDDFLRLFVDPGGLAPQAHVVDAGCGIGRMARPLARFLTSGSYVGFDVARADVEWCARSYAAVAPRFAFHHLDVANASYNPRGRLDAEQVTLPWPDGEFDFAIATSLFTHLRPAAAERYLAELGRLLAPGGRLFATFFLLDAEAHAAIAGGRTELRFGHALGAAHVQDPRRPEAAVAFPVETVAAWLASAGFEPPAIHPGGWRGRPDGLCYQDLVVAQRVS